MNRLLSSNKQVFHQIKGRIHRIGGEIGNPFRFQNLFIDEEISGALTGRPFEDVKSGVGHDIGFSAALHQKIAAQQVLNEIGRVHV